MPEPQPADLRRRLAQTRRPEKLPDVGWERGVPTGYLTDRGGNFAALEEPDLLIEDVRAFRRLIKE